VNETGRLVSLGVAALLANGATEPRRHIFLAAAGKVATLIVTKSPLSSTRLEALSDAAMVFEPPGMDGAVCKAMMLRIVTTGAL